MPAEVIRDGDTLFCQLTLPTEIARSEWTIYKVARDFATGRMFMDKEVIIPQGKTIQLRIKWRGKEFRYDLALAHTATGTILVWK